jgi:phosphoenolpyruvate carboxylase
VCQGERGYDLKYGGKRVAYVRPLRGLNRATVGYFCVARCDELGIDLRNTCDTPAPTIEEAKSQCIAYVRECLARKVPDAD